MRSTGNYRELLLEDLASRKASNPSYSRRAYAKRLGLSPAFLTQVLNGNRNLSPKAATEIATKLDWPAQKRRRFVAMLKSPDEARRAGPAETEIRRVSYNDVSERVGRRLADDLFCSLTPMKIFTAMALKDVQPEPKWFAERLGCSLDDAREYLDMFKELGFLVPEKGKLKRKVPACYFVDAPEQIRHRRNSAYLREFSRNVVRLGVNRRPFMNAMMAVDPAKLPEARAILLEALAKMATVLEGGDKTHLFSFVCGFAPSDLLEVEAAPPPLEPNAYAGAEFPKK